MKAEQYRARVARLARFYKVESRLSVPGDRRRYPAKDTIFADSNPPTTDTLESRIATAIWRWKFASVDQRPSIVTDSKLASMLEFWFPFSQIEQTQRLGTWCDGIPLLNVDQIDRVTFFLSGVGCFPHQFAPFETEWRFKNRRDRTPESITLRLGYVAPENQQSARQNPQPQRIYDSRPTKNSDWMVAVELTES
ncbi:hypothetical protein [Novipirellula caenicola]|uniref:Uncharacterized protein n=1 Tax=Novipirellula caenicola TaxID=1536901 RepID=A0ABP9VMK4_9BACT